MFDQEDEGVCLKVDVPDGNKEKFPRAAVEEAIEEFLRSGRWITVEHGKGIQHIRGIPTFRRTIVRTTRRSGCSIGYSRRSGTGGLSSA